jgi:hypothetical protein
MRHNLKVVFALFLILATLPRLHAQSQTEQTNDILKDVNFDDATAAIQDVDISTYIRDITGDLEALDEKFTTDSLALSETYINFRLQKVQELVNKPGGDCMTKYDLIAYKGQIFSEVSLKGLNPYILKLRAMILEKRNTRKSIYDKMVADANEVFLNAEKAKENAISLKMAKTMVKGRQDSMFVYVNSLAAMENYNITKLQGLETAKNLSIRNSLEPVEATKAGRGVICFKMQIKKIPDPVAIPVSSEGSAENADGNNLNGNENTEGGTTDGSQSVDGTAPVLDENGNPQ